MKLRLRLTNDYSVSYNALGLLAHQQGRFVDASALLTKARSSAEAVDDSNGVAKAVGNHGLVHSDLGDLDKARDEFLFFSQHAPDTLALANAYSNLGMVEARSGDPVKAIEWLNRARPLYVAIEYPAGEESVLGQLAISYSILGEQQKAIAYIDSAVTVARKYGLAREQSEDLIVYAELLGESGDHASALRHLVEAGALADSAGLESKKGDILLVQARQLAAVSKVDAGLAKAREAVRIHRKSLSAFEELQDLLLVGELSAALGRQQAAHAALTDARSVAARLSRPVADEYLAIGAARVYDVENNSQEVLRVLPESLRFERLGPIVAAEAQSLRARAYLRLRRWPEAAVSGRKAVAALDVIRENIGEGPLRSAFTSDNARVYADLIVALLQLGRTDEAFEVADASKGRSLLEHLAAITNSGRSSAQDIAGGERLLRRIDYLAERLRAADTLRPRVRSSVVDRDQQEISTRLVAARNEYEDRLRRAARSDPRGSAIIGGYRLDAASIQKALLPHEILLEYFVASDRVFVFAVTRDAIASAVSVIKSDELTNRVRLASDLMKRLREDRRTDPIMRGLFDSLIRPVEMLPGYREASSLIVVPHSPLSSLPFAALIDDRGKRLVESKAVMTLSSASSLPALRRGTSGKHSDAYTVFVPFPSELKGTADEAKEISRNAANSRVLYGARATERELRAVLNSGRNVHIASHALVNQVNPMFSQIRLAAGSGGRTDDNGTVDVHELLQLPVRSSLVYLSGCETAAGSSWSTAFRRSQDYATLSQALLYAGADNVIATLWRIDDTGAGVFAARFYEALNSRDLISALATAQRQMILDKRYSAPRYWAAYTLSGAGFVKSRPQSGAEVAVQ
jgi:CHAT domain-containing protein